LENLLGAQALALADRVRTAGPGPSTDSAALVTLLAHPGHTVTWLGDILGLTSSGITRLVDRLDAAGWVTRTIGADARSRRLRLTSAGRGRARTILRARQAAMTAALEPLTDRERNELERLLDILVGHLASARLPAMQVCRLCDRAACRSGAGACPLDHTVDADDPDR
jgi:DNA-binding MarR family transcriptional regulator